MIKVIRTVTVIILYFALIASSYGAQKKKNIGVLAFENQTGKAGFQFLSNSLGEAATKELSGVSAVNVVERLQFKKLLKEIEISQSGLLENEALLDEARLKNADYLLVGSYNGDSTNMRVFIRFVNVKSGKVETSASINGTIDEVFTKMGVIRSMANRLLSSDVVQINILTNPDGADIYIDSALVGKSPLTAYSLLPGKHEILIIKKGYQDYTEKITIEEKAGKKTENYRFVLYPESSYKYFLQAGIFYWGAKDFAGDHLSYSVKAGTRWHRYSIFLSFENNLNISEEYEYKIPYKSLKEERLYQSYTGLMGVTYPLFEGDVVSVYGGLGIGYSKWIEKEPDAILHEYEKIDYDIFAVQPIIGITFFNRSSLQMFIESAYFYGVNKVKMEKIKTIDFFGNKGVDENPTHLSNFTIGGGVRYAF